MRSPPASIIARARASACSGAMNSPPSENESGVTLSTPITAGIGRSSSLRSTSGPTEPAAGTDGEGEAFMRPALAVGEGGFKAGLRGSRHAARLRVNDDVGAVARYLFNVVPAK